MRKYAARRVLMMIPTALFTTMILFALMKLMPGDVALAIVYGIEDDVEVSSTKEEAEERLEKIRERYGLNDPIPVQYGKWLWKVVRLDLGDSIWQYRPVKDIILERAPRTFQLGAMTMFLSYALGIPLGILAAMWHNRWQDQVIRVATVAGLSVPTIWLGTLFLFTFSRYVGWIPPLDWKGPFENPFHNFQMIIVPVIIVGVHGVSSDMRFVRAQMLEVIREDYIRTARAKGLATNVILVRHALRNALLPVLTGFGAAISRIIAGSVVVETIFHIPGMGRSMIDAISARDYPVIQGLVLLFVAVILLVTLFIDLLYSWVDPRIRYE
jgi:peptide/nickel transport system permease protein